MIKSGLASLARLFHRKPRVLLLVDYAGWAFDHSALELKSRLGDEFDVSIHYLEGKSPLSGRYDLIYVFFWGEFRHRRLGISSARFIKQVSSHRWTDDPRFGPCSEEEMVRKYLSDANTVTCTSVRLFRMISGLRPRVFHTPNGVNTQKFRRLRDRSGSLRIGWAGNAKDSVKGLYDIIQPACGDQYSLSIAPGALSHEEMREFYNNIDVLVVASTHEGEPLTLLEAMACGCYPVCVNVGVVPELINDYSNGIIVQERTIDSFREGFAWCESNLEKIRAAGAQNAELVQQTRNWDLCAEQFRMVFRSALAHASDHCS